MLAFDVSERTMARFLQMAHRHSDPVIRWATFLSNHREAIAAMDFFTTPTLVFGGLCCLFVIARDQRHVVHFNVTRHPTSK